MSFVFFPSVSSALWKWPSPFWYLSQGTSNNLTHATDETGLLFLLNCHITWNCENCTHLWPGRLDLTQIGRLACRRHWRRSVQTQPPFPPAQLIGIRRQRDDKRDMFCYITQLSPKSIQTTGSWEDKEDPDLNIKKEVLGTCPWVSQAISVQNTKVGMTYVGNSCLPSILLWRIPAVHLTWQTRPGD